jgi:membrane protease subunit HflC
MRLLRIREEGDTMRFLWILILILIAAVILVSQVFFTVGETNQAIVLQFGEPIRTVRNPGLHTKLPFIQNLIILEKRILSSDAPPQEYLTTDKKRLVVDHVTRWRIEDPLLFFQAVGTEAGARARLDDIVFSELREELAKVDFVEVISRDRENIMERVAGSAEEKAREFGTSAPRARSRRLSCALRRTGNGRSSWPRAMPRPRPCAAKVRHWRSRFMLAPWSKTRSSTPSPAAWTPIRSP